MKHYVFVRFHSLALATLFTLSGSMLVKAADAFKQNSRLGRGVNLLGWDVIWQDPARSKLKETHF